MRTLLFIWFLSLVYRMVSRSPSKWRAILYLAGCMSLASVAAGAVVWITLGTEELDAESFMARFTQTTDGASASGVIAAAAFIWAGIIACIVRLKVLDHRAEAGKETVAGGQVKN